MRIDLAIRRGTMRISGTFLLAVVTMFAAFSIAIAQDNGENESKTEKSVTIELDEYSKRSSKRYSREKLEAGRNGIAAVRASGVMERALNVGASMPSFTLNDAYGKPVRSEDLLREGNLVVVFYRGAWCPYCNIYLRGLQRRIPDFESQGAKLVAISVEPPDRSLSVKKRNSLNYTVLSDPEFAVARKFGIVYELPKVVDELYKGFGLDVAKHNESEKAELPLSATYVISGKGKIVYAFLEPDYKKRADPEVLLEVLKKLRKSR